MAGSKSSPHIVVVELHTLLADVTAPTSTDICGERVSERIWAVWRTSCVGAILTWASADWNIGPRIRLVATWVCTALRVAR